MRLNHNRLVNAFCRFTNLFSFRFFADGYSSYPDNDIDNDADDNNNISSSSDAGEEKTIPTKFTLCSSVYAMPNPFVPSYVIPIFSLLFFRHKNRIVRVCVCAVHRTHVSSCQIIIINIYYTILQFSTMFDIDSPKSIGDEERHLRLFSYIVFCFLCFRRMLNRLATACITEKWFAWLTKWLLFHWRVIQFILFSLSIRHDVCMLDVCSWRSDFMPSGLECLLISAYDCCAFIVWFVGHSPTPKTKHSIVLARQPKFHLFFTLSLSRPLICDG